MVITMYKIVILKFLRILGNTDLLSLNLKELHTKNLENLLETCFLLQCVTI